MTTPTISLYYKDGASFTSFNAPIQGMTISRGRSRQLNRFESGSATITFYNGDRKLDPLNTGSTYYGKVVPRIQFQIKANSTPIFTGFVTDWDLEYDLAKRDTATAYCSDGMTLLSNYVFTEVTSFDEGSCSKRITDVLDHFDYQGTSSLTSGNVTLANDDVDINVQCTDYLFRAAQSDNGNFFVDSTGAVTFIGRYGKEDISEVTFADDGTGIGYSGLKNQYGDELLYNRVSLTSVAGTETIENTTSISSYGLSVFTFDNLLNANFTELESLADDLLTKYSEPTVRFTGLAVELSGLSTANANSVLGLEIADQVSVKKSFTAGSPGSVTQKLIVSGIRHQIVPGSHMIEFSFEPSPYKTAFILDSSTKGLLDTHTLG